MIAYASNTRTKRNLAALSEAGWRIFLTPINPNPPEGFKYACDNGAWGCHQQNIPFEEGRFKRLIERSGAAADFVIAPDIVAGGTRSLEFSESWMPYLKNLRLTLLALQDGMGVDTVLAFLRRHPNVGLFLGGSTEYKLRTMFSWGAIAHAFGRYYHVGRCNTMRRIRLASEAGADSFDGTSATRFACTLPLLEAAHKQPHLFSARDGYGLEIKRSMA